MPQATRARLTGAEVLVLRLATGRLGHVLNTALGKGTAESVKPWATTLACLTSALLKLIDAQERAPSPTSGVNAFMAVCEKTGSPPIFHGAAATSGCYSKGFLCVTSDPWVAREALGEGIHTGKRCLVMLKGGLQMAADIKWVSQFPQMCERILPPSTTLSQVQLSANAPIVSATQSVKCVEAVIERYVQSPPIEHTATSELASGVSVPGCAKAIRWATDAFAMPATGGLTGGLYNTTELHLPLGTTLSLEDAGLLGLLCGRGAKEACPKLEEVSLRGSSLAPQALNKLIEGLRGGHANGEELTLDLHGALKTSLTSRPGDAASVGDAIGLLLKHAPYISELDIGGAPLGVAGIGPIATALGESKSLAHLGLAAINLGERADGVKKLVAAIRLNGELLSLDVRHNNLSADAVKQLKSAAASRPRSASGGQREPLDLRAEPQAPLRPGELLHRGDDDYTA